MDIAFVLVWKAIIQRIQPRSSKSWICLLQVVGAYQIKLKSYKMSLFESVDIRQLAKVLKGQNSDEERNSDDDEAVQHGIAKSSRMDPSDIGRKKQDTTANANNEIPEVSKTKAPIQSDNIWSETELEMNGDVDSARPDISSDSRKVPAYEMHFRQSVSPEDIFLQMGNKTPSTASCEDLVIKIFLPGEDHKLMVLDLKHKIVELRSPQYILILPLPHMIDPNAGSAAWDKDKETLLLTLKLKRPMDMFNF